ncbi:DeoR/GlpR family DNA-binding transcription regulator [Chakrabartyella piscis]|uniref:DeoR/GlpR family DNA-binding transcription regulator n=1 Tax=Chakrabartyella piscis TaxID=2918914 RepID=UPI0029587608|nr:DeoR/GlpR family DNA-binding transcription regulator [Chakrabartyella piscis]
MNPRQTNLIAYVSEHGKTEVSVLAEHLNISKVTIRKDLEYLSEKGILKRTRGFAVLNDPGDINYRLAFHYEEKLRIAKLAASCVEDGETVIIESGSTCAIFAEELVKTKENLTIVTNCMHIATYIKDYPNHNIIVLGGNLQPKTQALVGPITKAAIQTISVDKIFVGADGYSRNQGFTGTDLMRLDTLRTMIASAKKTYVLVESEKFDKAGTVSFLPLDSVYEVVTDDQIPTEEAEYLESVGIILSKA